MEVCLAVLSDGAVLCLSEWREERCRRGGGGRFRDVAVCSLVSLPFLSGVSPPEAPDQVSDLRSEFAHSWRIRFHVDCCPEVQSVGLSSDYEPLPSGEDASTPASLVASALGGTSPCRVAEEVGEAAPPLQDVGEGRGARVRGALVGAHAIVFLQVSHHAPQQEPRGLNGLDCVPGAPEIHDAYVPHLLITVNIEVVGYVLGNVVERLHPRPAVAQDSLDGDSQRRERRECRDFVAEPEVAEVPDRIDGSLDCLMEEGGVSQHSCVEVPRYLEGEDSFCREVAGGGWERPDPGKSAH
jgi:hypothetical protein